MPALEVLVLGLPVILEVVAVGSQYQPESRESEQEKRLGSRLRWSVRPEWLEWQEWQLTSSDVAVVVIATVNAPWI